MKPVSLIFLLIFLAVASSVPAEAETYLGLDTSFNEIIWRDPASSYPASGFGTGVHIGERFLTYFGAEIGYVDSYGNLDYGNNSQVNTNLSYRLSIREFPLDTFAYLPLGPDGWFQPFLTLGGAYSEANARLRTVTIVANSSGAEVTTTSYTSYFRKQEVDWRAGFGMEFRPLSDISARFTVRYQPYTFSSKMSGGAILGLSLNATL